MPEFFKPEPGLMIWTFISFLIFLALMSKFAIGPIIDMLERRRKTIEENITKAEEARQEAERLFAEYQVQLERAKQEAQLIIEEGRKIAEKMRSEIIENARKDADTLKERTLKAIDLEKEKALGEIKGLAADISIEIASKILKREVSAKENEEIIREMLSRTNKRYEN